MKIVSDLVLLGALQSLNSHKIYEAKESDTLILPVVLVHVLILKML